MTDMTDTGRPEYNDEQYESWLDDMKPFLKMGCSLYYSMDKAILLRKKDSIYRKYRLNDWFCEKIDAYQRYLGEIVNSIISRFIYAIDEKVRRGENLTDEEWRMLRFVAEKHRSCQPFFVNRHEVTQSDEKDIEKILETIEQTNYDEVAKEAQKILNPTKNNQPTDGILSGNNPGTTPY